jgi:hypothetical protein
MSDFGKPNYGGKKEFKKKNDWSLEQGDQTFRIIPPRGNLKESGRWSQYYSVIWGFKNTQGKLRPFASPFERNEDKTTKVPCAASDFINNLKARLEKAKEEGNQQAVASLTALCAWDPVAKKPGNYSIDSNHHLNVVDLNGNVGKLKLRHKHKQKLDVEIDKLRAAGIDPLSPDDGRFFTFSKSGKNFDTDVKVTVYKQKVQAMVDGEMAEVEKTVSHKIDAALANKIKEDAFDLEKLFTFVTAEECKAIVDNVAIGTGISLACDDIFDARWKAQREANKAPTALPNKDNVGPYEYNNAHAAVRPVTQVPTQLVAPAVTIVAPVAQMPSAAPTAQAAPVIVAPKTVVQAVSLDDMSNDDFFAMIGQ